MLDPCNLPTARSVIALYLVNKLLNSVPNTENALGYYRRRHLGYCFIPLSKLLVELTYDELIVT